MEPAVVPAVVAGLPGGSWGRRRRNECHATEIFRDKVSDEVNGVNPENNGSILLSGISNGVVEEIFNQAFSDSVSTGVVEVLRLGT